MTLWNVRTRRTRVLRLPPAAGGAPAYALAFSADGKRLVVGLEVVSPTTPGLLVLDVASGRTLRMRTFAHVAVADVAFAPDGEHVAVAQTLLPFGNGRIVLLDARTLAGDRTLATLRGVDATAVAFRPDGSAVAFGGADGTAGLVSVQTGQPIASYLGQTAAINQVAFSPDGRIVATASTDGTTRVWRARGEEQQSILAGGAVAGLATLAGGVEAIVAKDDRARHTFVVQTWSNPAARPGKPLEISPTNAVDAVFLSGDGRLAAIIPLPRGLPKAPIQIWNVAKRRVTTVPPLTTPFGGEPDFSPGGSSIAMGIPEGTAVAGPPTKPPSRKPPPGARPKRPQPEMVVVDVRTGKSRRLGTTACGVGWKSQPFSPDGKLLAAGSFCGQVYVWNLASGRQVGRPLSIGGELADIAFSPDATRIAIASWNSTITIADVRTGHVVAVLTDHTRGVTNVAYSPDGRYLASASLDHTARVWDAHTLRLLRILDHPDAVYNLAFSSDGRELVTSTARGSSASGTRAPACGDRAALLALAKARVTALSRPRSRVRSWFAELTGIQLVRLAPECAVVLGADVALRDSAAHATQIIDAGERIQLADRFRVDVAKAECIEAATAEVGVVAQVGEQLDRRILARRTVRRAPRRAPRRPGSARRRGTGCPAGRAPRTSARTARTAHCAGCAATRA